MVSLKFGNPTRLTRPPLRRRQAAGVVLKGEKRCVALTFKSTYIHLFNNGVMREMTSVLRDHELAERLIYISSIAENELDVLDQAGPDFDSVVLPADQVSRIQREFVLGRPLVRDSQYKKLNPINKSVWELKTKDTRLIGFFPAKSIFLVTACKLRKDLKPYSKFNQYIDRTVNFYTHNNVSYITGGYDEVL